MDKDSEIQIDTARISSKKSQLELLTKHFENVFFIGPRAEDRFDPGNAATSENYWDLNRESLRLPTTLWNYSFRIVRSSSFAWPTLLRTKTQFLTNLASTGRKIIISRVAQRGRSQKN